MAKMEYVLTDSRLRANKNRGCCMVCCLCGEVFRNGDHIVYRRNRKTGRRYHKACWESLFIDA